MEHIRAHDDLPRLKWDFGEMFPIFQPSEGGWTKRGLLITAGLLGSAVAELDLGSSCFLKGVFGGCDQMSKGNKRAINVASQQTQSMHSEWIRVQNATKEKFYMVGSVLKELRRIQDQLASIQRVKAQTMITQLQITFEEKLFTMLRF